MIDQDEPNTQLTPTPEGDPAPSPPTPFSTEPTLGGGGDPGPGDPAPWKEKVQAKMQDLRRAPWVQRLQGQLQDFDPSSVAGWMNQRFQKQGFSLYGKILTVTLCAWFLADVAALFLGRLIPEPEPVRTPRATVSARRVHALEDYGIIFSRNIFNSQGLIPGEEVPAGGQDPGGPATKTTLPFNLVGTLILRDELRSIATIEDKSASMVYPVRIEDEIPNKARILKIEPTRVTFVNIGSNRREYVELPETFGAGARITLGAPRGGGGPGIEQVAPTQYNIQRSEVDKALGDLNNILTQARAVPHFENGVPAGYKIFQIVPGSIYSKLGIQENDVITGIDGEPINDPGQAFSKLSNLKTTPHLELQIKRNGRTQTYAYDIR